MAGAGVKMRYPTTRKLGTLVVLAALVAFQGGCAAAGDAYSAEGADVPQNGSSNNGSHGSEVVSLYDSSLEEARASYASTLDVDPSNGQAAAGHAVTDLLLLPYASETTAVLRRMGASDSLDAQGDVIYGESGFLYFLSRGVPWEDTGPETVGIKSLLVDQLPWTRKQLDSADGFVEGLNDPVDLATEDLVKFAGRLDEIKGDIDTALDDPGFTSYFVPGEVFHEESLDLTLGRGELELLGASLSGVQSTIYFFAAYEHGWTLERAFGTGIWEEVVADPEHPDHVEGWTAEDYQVAHLNESFLRTVGRPMMLARAQQSFADMFARLRRGLERGMQQTMETTLGWQEVDEAAVSDLIEFLGAMEQAATGPSELPFTDPVLTVDFSPLFSGEGRTVPEETDVFLLQRYENEFGATETSVELNEDALDVLLDGVFDPPYGSKPAPELSTADQFEALVDGLSGDFTSDVEGTYSGSF
jgi:hypothetical protein